MNLNKLFELQRKLDEHIIKEKGLEGQDLLPKKILALQVELGELCNCWRGFKFWNGRQEPVTEDLRVVDYKESGEAILETYNPLLEEYVDCLHFILSIGLEMETKKEWGHSFKIGSSIISQFHALFGELSSLFYYNQMYNYQRAFDLLIGLGEMLGFTWEQIETAYYEKNKINHQRQESGY